MTFKEVVNQVIDWLQQDTRISYRALKRQFDLDDEYLDDLKDAILYTYPQVTDDGRGLVWTGEAQTLPDVTSKTQPPPQLEVSQETQLIQAESLPGEPPTPDAERRQLTVMFCDLADSTKLSGQLDPEDLRDVIRAYQSTSAELIERYDGYIAQHLGDGLMVYFGWPQAHEDDARRAVHAGLGILKAMQGLNTRLEQEKSIRLAVRIGIHTGLVVVGEIGHGARQEHLALGETPNVASRIEGVAAPDTVAISNTTYQLIQGYFVCEDLGQHTLKGVDAAHQVYRVVRESDVQSRFEVAAVRRLTPLVGRETETTLLFERWQQVKEGQGQVVLLSGETGIGKSRLLQVLRDHIAGEPHVRLECRSSPYYQNTALYPITDLLQRALRWQQDDTSEQRLEKLEQALSQYRLPLEDLVPLFAPLLSLQIPEDRYPPLNLSPQRQRQKTLESIVAILLKQAEQQPAVFILEDLHWTDPTTLELLDLIVDHAPTVSLLTLLTCRPEFEPTWELRSHLTPVVLNRLTRAQIEAMVDRLTEGKALPAEVMHHLSEKTDGVPLFVEEMTKAVLESGTLKEANGQYEMVGAFASLAIPATLQDSLMGRLDRLVTAKGIAQYAAVMGRQFSYALLHAVLRVDETTLQREIGQLVEAELVYQRGLPPYATYTFKHALIQDAAYQSLLKSTRQHYHQRIAQVLEKQFSETTETQPELLAHHYTEAGLTEQAIPYWQQAGQRANERSANVEAIAHLTQGLALLTTLPETSERLQQELVLNVALGSALVATKGYAAPEVERVYTRARELCQRVDDNTQLFPVLRGLIMYYQQRGQLQTTYQLGEQFLSLARSQAEPMHLTASHYFRGMNLFLWGELVSAHTHHTQALATYAPQKHRDLTVYYGIDIGVVSHSWSAWELWLLGYPDQALQHSREACRLIQDVSHPFTLCVTLVFAAVLHQHRRESVAAYEWAKSTTTLATEKVVTLWLARGMVLKGWALAAQGQSAAGITVMRQGLTAELVTRAKVWQSYFLGLLAEAYGQGGQPEEGLPLLDEALAVMKDTEVRFYEAELHRHKGQLLLQQSSDNTTQAETCFHQAIAIAQNQQAKSWELRAATSLARLWQQQGKRQEAYDLLEPVYGWFTEGFDTADLKDAKALLDELGE